MRAVVLKGAVVEFVRDRPEPTPGPGETLVRVLQAGICETDLQLVRGYMGFAGVLGHEFVGVAETGPLRGERVVGEINCPCGDCAACRAGRGNHCPSRTVLGIVGRDGAFADRLALPQANLHRVPDEIPTSVAVCTEPLAAACRLREQLGELADRSCVVLGDGRLGNLCAQVLHASGARTTVVGKHASKLAALGRLGVATVQLNDALRSDGGLDLERADVVVDCTGSRDGFALALRAVRPLGIVVLKTTVADETSLRLAPVVIDEVTVIGSRCGPFDTALQWLRDERVDVAALTAAHRPLDEAVAALDEAVRTDVLKITLDAADA